MDEAKKYYPMMLEGTMSGFGGPDDDGMQYDEGLSWYEHHEADLRSDLFVPRSSDPVQGVSKRLRFWEAYYIALNTIGHCDRFTIHRSRWRITYGGLSVICHLVDTGPSANHRLVDSSGAVFRALGLNWYKNTDNVVVQVSEVTDFNIPFGLYEKKAC
jgi:hypothetical protein